MRVVAEGRQREAAGCTAPAVAQHAVQLLVAFGNLPRPVVVEQFQPVEQVAASHFRRTGEQAAGIAVAAQRQLRQRGVEAAEIVDMRRAGRREIALLGKIRPLAEGDPVDQLGDQEIEIGVALAVGMGSHVDRHAADVGREIGAVVEVEAAQEILVGLTVAGMLGDDQAGHHLQCLAGAQDGHGGQPLTGDHAFAAGRRDAFEILGLGADFDRRQLCRFMGQGAGRRQQQIRTN